MVYNVEVTDYALDQLDNILNYIINQLDNPDAASAVVDDFDEAIKKLERTAGSLKLCEESELAQHGYRRYHLARHRYILLYRIDGKNVFIDRIYHELQDYQNLEA